MNKTASGTPLQARRLLTRSRARSPHSRTQEQTWGRTCQMMQATEKPCTMVNCLSVVGTRPMMPNAGNSNESADEETRDEAARTITNQSTAHYGIVVGLSLGDGRVMVAFITRLSNNHQTTIKRQSLLIAQLSPQCGYHCGILLI